MLRFLLIMLLLMPTAYALDIYQGEVPVANQTAEARAEALGRALLEVAVKVSGDDTASANSTVIAAQANAERMMQRYEYRQELVREAGVPVIKLYLRGTFYPQGIEQLLGRAGLAVWGRERPAVAVYLFDGDSPLLARDAQALLQRAAQRGLELRFPGGVSAAELGDSEALASRLSSPGVNVLLGSIQGSLTLSDGKYAQTLAGNSNLRALADSLAVALARRYTEVRNEAPEQFAASVTGLRSAEDYSRVLRYLSTLSVVKKVLVRGTQSDALRLELTVTGGGARLGQTVALGKTLRMLSEDPWQLEVLN